MKRLISVLAVALVCACAFAALDFTSVDSLYDSGSNYKKVYDELKTMSDSASGNEEKAAVYWRLARVCVDFGDALDKKDSKGRLAIYTEGEQWGQKSIDTFATKESYQWHCSCIGRWGQTKGVLSSLAKVDPMIADLQKITDELKITDYSEAWYVLCVLYNSVPSKSNTEAISFARVSVDTIPANKLYLGNYKELAEQLWSRNWSASKRKTEIDKIQKNWNKAESSNLEHFKYYEGKNGSNGTVAWMSSKLGEVSDKDEAKKLLEYALSVYDKAKSHTPGDDKNQKEIKELLATYNK